MITVKPVQQNLDVTIPPSPWVMAHAPKIKAGGRVLDYACGTGRHALWLASQGFEVVAIDKDQALLDQIDLQAESIKAGSIKTLQFDLETFAWNLDHLGLFDGVIVTNYLYRPFLKNISKLLKNNGLLIYETFAVGNEAYGKPSNPDFLLRPNELLGLADMMHILAYEDLLISVPKPACVQRVCAVPLQSKT